MDKVLEKDREDQEIKKGAEKERRSMNKKRYWKR